MSSQKVKFKNAWKGFAFDRIIDDQVEVCSPAEVEGLVVISGCVTTTQPTQNKENYNLRLTNDNGVFDLKYRPSQQRRWFLTPITVSRYEGIRQCGASAWVNEQGHVYMHFSRNAIPMVVHFSGFAYSNKSHEDGIELKEADPKKLRFDEEDPPTAYPCGDLVLLQGCFQEARHGSSEKAALLPEELRPLREVRCLAPLLVSPDPQAKDLPESDFVGVESIAITVQPDGGIYVQGGFVYNNDKKGHMRKLPQKKKGKVCLDGVRFLNRSASTTPVEVSKAVQPKERGKEAVSSLLQRVSGGQATRSAVCKKLPGNVVVLEGAVDCVRLRNPKLAVARLPETCRPPQRMCFFTRDRSEERCRVDIDQWGRIFCPESPGTDGVELSGIIFVASAWPVREQPRDWDWDELNLQYAAASEETPGVAHQLVDELIQRCNKHEWDRFRYKIYHQMRLPLGDLILRGGNRDPFNFGNNNFERAAWRQMEHPLGERWGIRTPQQLFQLPKHMLEKVLDNTPRVNLDPRDRKRIVEMSKFYHESWEVKRQPGMTFKYLQDLAMEVADDMFERWDFDAQVKGLLENDSKPPEALRKYFGGRKYKDQPGQKYLKEDEKEKFETIRQFFYYHETNGNSMTHCSLKGCSDTFTNTGKWFFPDSRCIQDELFQSIAWLYERNIFHYISERQTARFPFIEDFDIQADVDYAPTPPGQERPNPPDELIMNKPTRQGDKVLGDPGELMQRRASCIRKLFSDIDDLRCLVYSASGFNKGKDKLKTSFHLVWPQLVVDSDSAPWLREITLMIFKEESAKPGSYLAELQKTLLSLEKGVPADEGNIWSNVFDKTTINATNGLRLPYNDKASMKPTPDEKIRIQKGEVSKSAAKKVRVIEGRPSKAIGEINFKFEKSRDGQDRLVEAKWVADTESRPLWEWIRDGSCRIDANDPEKAALTPMHPTDEAMKLFKKWKKNDKTARKEGVRYFWDQESDEYATHAPYTNIKLCPLSVRAFQDLWDEQLLEECEALFGSRQQDLVKQLEGRWISITKTQAVWRTDAKAQFDFKNPTDYWGQKMRQMKRPAELIYLRFTPPGSEEEIGKVILDGPEEIVLVLLQVLEMDAFKCEKDDRPIMPLYDVRRMCKY